MIPLADSSTTLVAEESLCPSHLRLNLLSRAAGRPRLARLAQDLAVRVRNSGEELTTERVAEQVDGKSSSNRTETAQRRSPRSIANLQLSRSANRISYSSSEVPTYVCMDSRPGSSASPRCSKSFLRRLELRLHPKELIPCHTCAAITRGRLGFRDLPSSRTTFCARLSMYMVAPRCGWVAEEQRVDPLLQRKLYFFPPRPLMRVQRADHRWPHETHACPRPLQHVPRGSLLWPRSQMPEQFRQGARNDRQSLSRLFRS